MANHLAVSAKESDLAVLYLATIRNPSYLSSKDPAGVVEWTIGQRREHWLKRFGKVDDRTHFSLHVLVQANFRIGSCAGCWRVSPSSPRSALGACWRHPASSLLELDGADVRREPIDGKLASILRKSRSESCAWTLKIVGRPPYRSASANARDTDRWSFDDPGWVFEDKYDGLRMVAKSRTDRSLYTAATARSSATATSKSLKRLRA